MKQLFHIVNWADLTSDDESLFPFYIFGENNNLSDLFAILDGDLFEELKLEINYG